MSLPEIIRKQVESHKKAHLEIFFKLQDSEISELVEILKNRPDIRSLDLSGNQIKDEGAKKLTELTHLINLNVSGAKFGRESAIALLKNKNLVSLDLSGNKNLYDDLGDWMLENGNADHVVVKIERTSMSKAMRGKIQKYYDDLREKKRQELLAKKGGKDITSDQKIEIVEKTSHTTSIHSQSGFSEDLEEKKKFTEKTPLTTKISFESTFLKEPEETKLGSPHQSHAKKTTSILNWFNLFSKRNVVNNIENSAKDNANLIKLR